MGFGETGGDKEWRALLFRTAKVLNNLIRQRTAGIGVIRNIGGLESNLVGERQTLVFGFQVDAEIGRPMAFDHHRILATAMGRLRGKLKYRPVVFELLPPEFTLLDLQKTVEAISGTLLHKQNFRRLVEQGGLVEPTGNVSTETSGRPAKLYRFRREVVLERPAPGLRVKSGRAQP